MPRLKSRRVPDGSPCSSGRRPIQDPSGIVYFRAGLDGDPDGVRQGRVVTPDVARHLEYERNGPSKALIVGEGTRVRYDLGKGFPHESGCLEFRFKPNFPQTSEQPGRTVLRLWGKGGCSITLSFQPIGYAWEFLVKGPREKHSLRAWYGVARQGRWSHLLLVWDQGARPRPALSFYHNGKVAYGSMRAFHSSPLRGLTCLEVGGTGKGQVTVDEIAVYNRPLSQAQARFLSFRFRDPDRRFAELAERIERGERREQARAEGRRALLKKLEGKIGGLLQLRGHKPHEIAFPEGIRATAVRPEDVGKTDLSRFSVIHFPPGGNYQLTDEEKRRIVDYVKKGGGYVGVCMGASHRPQTKASEF